MKELNGIDRKTGTWPCQDYVLELNFSCIDMSLLRSDPPSAFISFISRRISFFIDKYPEFREVVRDPTSAVGDIDNLMNSIALTGRKV